VSRCGVTGGRPAPRLATVANPNPSARYHKRVVGSLLGRRVGLRVGPLWDRPRWPACTSKDLVKPIGNWCWWVLFLRICFLGGRMALPLRCCPMAGGLRVGNPPPS